MKSVHAWATVASLDEPPENVRAERSAHEEVGYGEDEKRFVPRADRKVVAFACGAPAARVEPRPPASLSGANTLSCLCSDTSTFSRAHEEEIRPFANCSPNVLRNPAAGSPVTLCLRGFDSRMGMRHVLCFRGEVAAAAAAAAGGGAASGLLLLLLLLLVEVHPLLEIVVIGGVAEDYLPFVLCLSRSSSHSRRSCTLAYPLLPWSSRLNLTLRQRFCQFNLTIVVIISI